jgi:chorismate mutase
VAAVAVRAVRGATRVDRDEAAHLLDRACELVVEVMRANGLDADDVISVLFTSTGDLRSQFPAQGARQMGLVDVPLLCAQELDVDGAMPGVVRLLAHVATDRPRAQISHVYLHGTDVLRDDLRRNPTG